MHGGPRNRFLADSAYPIAHGRCDQQDSTPLTGPRGPSAALTAEQLTYSQVGPGHFGHCISGPYPDGRRVIWSSGRNNIVKLDYATLAVLAERPKRGIEPVTNEQMEQALEALDCASGQSQLDHALQMAVWCLAGLDGVYCALCRDNLFYTGTRDGVVAYTDADAADPASPIIELRRWHRPAEVEGEFVGMNMTFDGRLVLSTDHGWVVCLERDFSSHAAVPLTHSETAADWCRNQTASGRRGYGWVRTSMCVDEANGIYVCSRDHLHKVVWTGRRLSTASADGAWCEPYLNGTGQGSGTTPSLMGFGPQDRLVVIGDGEPVVNITLFWRDDIPADWDQLPGAPSRRIAGVGRADMGRPELTEVQTEQSITVSGYGAMTVNNEPASIPPGFPPQAVRLLVGFLATDPDYTPYGLQKFEWDPEARRFAEAWINSKVSSPNSVPYVSEGAGIVYTAGVRDGCWTVEGLDWQSGKEVFHYVLGGARFNTLFAGVTLDDDSRLLFGTVFGKARVSP